PTPRTCQGWATCVACSPYHAAHPPPGDPVLLGAAPRPSRRLASGGAAPRRSRAPRAGHGQGNVTPVDQQKIRRTRTGLIAHDPARAQPGYTLFAPMLGDGTVCLVDMDGKSAHTWRLPYPPGLYGHLLDNGHLFYSGKVLEDLERFEAWPRFKGGAVLEVDWQGRILWEVRHPDHHHDARRLRNGNVLLLCLAPLPAQIARDVRGGQPGTEADGVIYADYLVEMTTRG